MYLKVKLMALAEKNSTTVLLFSRLVKQKMVQMRYT